MENYFIIPQKSGGVVSETKNNAIINHGKINIPFNSKSVITKNKFIFSLCYHEKELKIFDSKHSLVNNIKDFNYNSINSIENTVYLGGSAPGGELATKGELFSIIDFKDMDFRIKNIEIPIDTTWGKRVDDILKIDSDIFLVDNIIFPKYLIKYDCSIPNQPKHIFTKLLPTCGTYEHIIKGDTNNKLIILFSSTVGEWGCANHISIFEKELTKMTRNNIVSENEPCLQGKTITSNEFSFEDICLINNKIFILGSNGLGYIDLEEGFNISKYKLIKKKTRSIKKILRTPSNKLLAFGKKKYELINLM